MDWKSIDWKELLVALILGILLTLFLRWGFL